MLTNQKMNKRLFDHCNFLFQDYIKDGCTKEYFLNLQTKIISIYENLLFSLFIYLAMVSYFTESIVAMLNYNETSVRYFIYATHVFVVFYIKENLLSNKIISLHLYIKQKTLDALIHNKQHLNPNEYKNIILPNTSLKKYTRTMELLSFWIPIFIMLCITKYHVYVITDKGFDLYKDMFIFGAPIVIYYIYSKTLVRNDIAIHSMIRVNGFLFHLSSLKQNIKENTH